MCVCVVLVCCEMILITQVLSVWNKGRCRHYRVYYDQVIFVCVCVCVCVCAHACSRMHVMCVCMHGYMCVCGWVGMCMCLCVYANLYKCFCVCTHASCHLIVTVHENITYCCRILKLTHLDLMETISTTFQPWSPTTCSMICPNQSLH